MISKGVQSVSAEINAESDEEKDEEDKNTEDENSPSQDDDDELNVKVKVEDSTDNGSNTSSAISSEMLETLSQRKHITTGLKWKSKKNNTYNKYFRAGITKFLSSPKENTQSSFFEDMGFVASSGPANSWDEYDMGVEIGIWTEMTGVFLLEERQKLC